VARVDVEQDGWGVTPKPLAQRGGVDCPDALASLVESEWYGPGAAGRDQKTGGRTTGTVRAGTSSGSWSSTRRRGSDVAPKIWPRSNSPRSRTSNSAYG
ncbi:MAG: hypothetical protein HY329_19040, partial [Chloroflexi bacterium]|nr:hypothetical protein [Chloroflexota bacterium]